MAAAYAQATRGGKNATEIPTIADAGGLGAGTTTPTATGAMGGGPPGVPPVATSAPAGGEPPRGGSIVSAVNGQQSATTVYLTATNVFVQGGGTGGGQSSQMGGYGQAAPPSAPRTSAPDHWQSQNDFDRDLHFSCD